MLQDSYCKKNRNCVDLIICILISILTFTIGLLIGAYTRIVVLQNLGVIIAVIAILVILLIIRIINLICYKDNKEAYYDYDKY